MKEEIKIVKEENKKANRFIKHNLHKYNVNHCDYIMRNSTKFHNNKIEGNFTIYDNGKIVGGVLGYIKYGWYYLDEFYIDEGYRNKNIGSKMIKIVEKFAKENKALGVRVDSWSFQAPLFYQKLGYKVCNIFEDCPPGTKTYYMYKRF